MKQQLASPSILFSQVLLLFTMKSFTMRQVTRLVATFVTTFIVVFVVLGLSPSSQVWAQSTQAQPPFWEGGLGPFSDYYRPAFIQVVGENIWLFAEAHPNTDDELYSISLEQNSMTATKPIAVTAWQYRGTGYSTLGIHFRWTYQGSSAADVRQQW
jgi:hypothetical protein